MLIPLTGVPRVFSALGLDKLKVEDGIFGIAFNSLAERAPFPAGIDSVTVLTQHKLFMAMICGVKWLNEGGGWI